MPVEFILLNLPVIIALGVLLHLAWLDWRYFLLPNRHCLALAILFLILAAMQLPLTTIGLHLLVGIAVLLIGAGIFYFGWLGGGDVKLLAALALWAGPEQIHFLILGTALFGGVQALAMIVSLKLAKQGESWRSTPMPYGLSIIASGILVIAKALLH